MSLREELRSLTREACTARENEREATGQQECKRIAAIKERAHIEGKEFFDSCVKQAKAYAGWNPSSSELYVHLLDARPEHQEIMHHEAAWKIAIALLQAQGIDAEAEISSLEEPHEMLGGNITVYSFGIKMKW